MILNELNSFMFTNEVLSYRYNMDIDVLAKVGFCSPSLYSMTSITYLSFYVFNQSSISFIYENLTW